jgi:hypothetical protein
MIDFDFMALDSGTLSEFLAVPVIIATWILVVVFLDRWVRKGVDQGARVTGTKAAVTRQKGGERSPVLPEVLEPVRRRFHRAGACLCVVAGLIVPNVPVCSRA